jgi:ABC-type Fe3+-siderophore transport system permease subunit
MKKAIAASAVLISLASPLVAFAALNNISDVGSFVINLINNVAVPVLFAVAFIVFLWGVFDTFILGRGSEEAKESGKNLMLWGLIGFFVMVSVWGLVNILTGTISFGNNSGPSQVPQTGVQVGQ